MKTIEVKLNDYNAPTELPISIIDLLNEEKRLLEKIKMVEDNKVIIREQILKKAGEYLKEQLESMFSKIGMSVIKWTSNVKSNEYRVEVGFDYSKTITFLLEVSSTKNEELSRHPRHVWEYGTELSLYVFSKFTYYNKNNISELWGNGCNRHNNYKECGSYTEFDINSFMERNFNTIKEIIVLRNNQIKV